MYFDAPGPVNTPKVIEIVLAEAQRRGLTHLVVAATGGDSAKALLAAATGRDVKIVAVSHNYGFSEEGKVGMNPEIRAELIAAGHQVLTATMATRNINKAISTKFGGYSQTEIVSATLRIFGQGMKVCPEIAAMAADAGLIPFDDVIAVAGTGRGWDTAVVIRATSSNRFFDLKIREVLCKPKSF
jgi:uncharacterized protein